MMLRYFAAVGLFFLVPGLLYGQQKVSLEEVIELALETNYDVRLARTDAESASTDAEYVVGAFLPTVGVTASTTWNNNNQELRFEDASRNNSGKAQSNNTTASAQLNWTLFDGTRMFATRERIAVIEEQGHTLVKNQMVNTIALVINNYYDIVRQKQQLRAIVEQMSVSEERVKLAERKLEVGTGIKPELLQARVDYNAQRTQAIQQESTIAQLKAQLNELVGLQLPEQFDVADTILIDLNLDRTELIDNLENTNFTLVAARQNVHIANLSLRERRAEFLPFLNFNASYTYSQTDNTRLINPFAPVYNKSNGYNYGLTLNFPLLNGFNTRRLTQQARIEVSRQSLLYDQLRTGINVDIRNAYVNYDNARKILLIEEENINLAKENVSIALEGSKRGVTTFIELRTAQQSLEEAYTRLITARYNTKVAETELLRLSGRLLR